MIRASKTDNIWMSIEVSDDGILLELRDYFSFQVPGFRFQPQYKAGVWDGSIKLFNAFQRRLYIGLLPQLKKFAAQFGYKLEISPDLFTKQVMSPEDVKAFADSLEPHAKGKKLKIRYYQYMGLYQMINSKRNVFVVPTAGGKSLMIYMFAEWLFRNKPESRIALVVPTTNLVEQMASDFDEYSRGHFSENVHKIYSGKDKNADTKAIYVTTWQSIYDLPEGYFDQFDSVIIDECHGAQAPSLKGLLEKTQAEYRFGLTGTMHDPEAHKWVIEGLLGETMDLITLQELMDRKWVANLKINGIVFDYAAEDKKEINGATYHEEVKYIINHEKRNAKVLKAVGKVKENSFVLFDKVEYGDRLYKELKEMYPDRRVYLVYGATNVTDRETIRKALEYEEGSIVVASYKVFSTGISINNLFHIFFAEPVGKSKFRIMQSIGRSIRLHDEKDFATLWDFVDKLCNDKNKMNHVMKHFTQRIMMYNRYELKYTILKVQL